jgi:hypothetical protein
LLHKAFQLKEFNEEVRQNSGSTKKLRLMNESGGERRITSVVDPFGRHEDTSRAIQQLYSEEYGNDRQPRGLEVQYRDPAIFRMIQENKVRNTAKLKKLAELIKAKRSITLAEKRKNRENTLALVKQFAAEARAKRGLQEPTNTPEEVEEVVGDPKDAEEDIENKDTPIPKELVPVPDSGPITNDTDFLYNEYYRIPDYMIQMICL